MSELVYGSTGEAWYKRALEAHAEIIRLQTELAEAKERQHMLFIAIRHGDELHQAWLKAAIEAHFDGKPVPSPSGQGTTDALRAELAELRHKVEEMKYEVDDVYAKFFTLLDELSTAQATIAKMQGVLGK